MELEFKHPTQNYTFKFKLLSDLYKDSLDTNSKSIYPKCKVCIGNLKVKIFLIYKPNKYFLRIKQTKYKRKDKLDKVIVNIKKYLSFTDNEIIYENTKINDIWKLKDIIDWDI